MELSLAYKNKVRAFKKERIDKKIKGIVDVIQADIEKLVTPFLNMPNTIENQMQVQYEYMNYMNGLIAEGLARREPSGFVVEGRFNPNLMPSAGDCNDDFYRITLPEEVSIS